VHEGYYELFFKTGHPVFYLLAGREDADEQHASSAAAKLQGKNLKV